MSYISIFAFLIALIIVVTRLILEYMEEKDRAKGLVINKSEYRISGILKLLWKEKIASIKNFFKRRKRVK